MFSVTKHVSSKPNLTIILSNSSEFCAYRDGLLEKSKLDENVPESCAVYL